MTKKQGVVLNKPEYSVEYTGGEFTLTGYRVVKEWYSLGLLGIVRRKRETVFFEGVPRFCQRADAHLTAERKCNAVMGAIASLEDE